MIMHWVHCLACKREMDVYVFKGCLTIHPCECCKVKYRFFKWAWKQTIVRWF